MSNKQRPIKTFRYGNLKLNIWENTNQNGEGQDIVTRNVTLTRTFYDKKEQGLKDTGSLRQQDIPVASKLLDLAAEFFVIEDEPADSAETDAEVEDAA